MEKNGQNFPDVEQSGPVPRPLCILIADDDRDSVLSLMMLLREEGHEVLGAYNAQQTLDAVLKNEPDAVVLDIALGESSGYDLARQIRARHGDDRPLIIAISGIYKKSSDRILAEINGFNAYLVKPYELKDLLAVLEPLRLPRASPKQIDHTKQEDTYRAALAHAAGLLGGARQLSDRLQVPMTHLTRWLAGKERPPNSIFLRVVDILIVESAKPRMQVLSGEVIQFPKPPEPSS